MSSHQSQKDSNFFSGFQDFKTNEKAARIEQGEYELHASAVSSVIEKQSIFWPEEWKEDILKLSSSLSSYGQALKRSNDVQHKNQSQLYPVRQISVKANAQFCPPVEKTNVNTILLRQSERVSKLH